MYVSFYDSPIGIIEINADDYSVTSIQFRDEMNDLKLKNENPVTILALHQLEEYFTNKRKFFDLPLLFNGTAFQHKVWTELTNIAYGKTISYLQLAINLGDAKCIRAAGTANGKNPFAIVVPCHRVIGSNGSLIGYASGLHRKQWLLEHEGKLTKQISLFY